MKLNKYSEYLKMVKEAVDTALIPFKVRKANKQLELRIIEVESQIATKEVDIQNTITEKEELNFDSIINAIDSKELLERKLKQLNELKVQLFN